MLRNNKKRIISIILLKILSLLILFLYLNNKSSSRKYIINNTNKLKLNKYIVFECIEGKCRGWADRLKGILSAYAWSLISNRKFYINIDKPCHLSNMLEPNKINWLTNFTQLYANFSNNKKYIIGYDNYKLRKSIINLTLDEFEQDSFDLIVIRNNLSWLKEMSKNKDIREKLIYLGYNPDKFNIQYLFHKWYNDLFKLNANLQVKYNNFLNKIKSNEILICAQVRIGGKYDINFTKRNNSIIYWNYIRNVFLNNNNNNNNKNYKLFVTTDTQSIELEAKKEFGNNNVIINEGLNTHLDLIQSKKVSSDCSEVSKTFLDFHSLQNCDKAIISQSGFGKLGVWLD